MRAFFHGWRRKAGVFTLVMACAVTIVWMRSWLIIDEMHISPPYPPQRRTYKTLSSERGHISWFEWTVEGGKAVVSETSFTTYLSTELTELNSLEIPLKEIKRFDWRFKCLLIDIGSTDVDDDGSGRFGYRHSTHCVVPYWSLVLPLTLLSAYLLLWKPGKREAPPQS
jgi:hypothetical protein